MKIGSTKMEVTLLVGVFLTVSLLLISGLGFSASAAEMQRSFTVADSIEMTKIIDVSRFDLSRKHEPNFKYSPSGEYFVLVTRRGSVGTGLNIADLILFRTADVLDFINAGETLHEALPEGKVIASFSGASGKNPIREVRWLSGGIALAFIGIGRGDEIDQVYSVDIVSMEITKVTNHPRSIESFDVDPGMRQVVYLSTVGNYQEERSSSVYLVGKKRIKDVINIDEEITVPQLYQYNVVEFGEPNLYQPVGLPFYDYPAPGIGSPRISPDGKWAIALQHPKEFPVGWVMAYSAIRDDAYYRRFVAESADTSGINLHLPQFVLINTTNRKVVPLLDAPSGRLIAGTSVAAHWIDAERVILSNTFLPLDVADPTELARRRRTPVIVEYNIRTKEIVIVTDVPTRQDDEFAERHAGVTVYPNGETVTKHQRSADAEHPLPDRHYRKLGGHWFEIDNADFAQERLVLSIAESMNVSPEILGSDTRTGKKRVITDLNPQFGLLSFGNVEEFSWSDVAGRMWGGAIVYPPDFDMEKVYPLVVQTHGFNSDEFLIDGPNGGTSAYAAQALANRGIMVLQMQDSSEGRQRYAQFQVMREGVEAAIDKLDESKLIDRRRVGLIGFSATGPQVHHLITFSDYEFAAATIADSTNPSLFEFVNLSGGYLPGFESRWVESVLNAVPWGEELSNWVDRSPTMNLDRLFTPLRLEQYNGDQYLFSYWDVYAILKRQKKPVDFFVFRNAGHVLKRPFERFISQQGNVDWFDFWLNRRERTEPYPGTPETKKCLEEQYKRWRKFREQQEESEIAAIKARKWHKEQEAKRKQFEQWLKAQEAANDEEAVQKAVNQ